MQQLITGLLFLV